MMQPSVGEWKITAEERAKHDAQFFQLKPINGFVSGQNAREFFLQSNLPPAVLGQIWELADFNKDGRLDKLEFSIAMHLIKKKLEKKELPTILPKSLMLQPAPMGYGGTQFPGMMGPMQGMTPMQPAGFGVMGQATAPGYMAGAQPGFGVQQSMAAPLARAGTLPAQSAVAPGSPDRSRSASAVSPEWAIPQSSKLKYKQMFNQYDRMKSGFIMGIQARNILMQSGLPQNILAQIWTLSDIDNDGKLTSDEFVVAMHLVDMARSGQNLPMALPAEMVPPSFRRARSGSFNTGAAVGLPPANIMSNVMQQPPPSPGAMAPPMSPSMLPKQESVDEPAEEFRMPVSFEDKKRQNFDKGQQELQRRRALLEEEQKKERERQLEIERREQEKKERARLEQERRRQMELEKMLARQLEIEAEQEEQRRKLIEQREAARREMERQRQLEMEKQRRQEMEARRIKEQGDVAHLKAKSKTLMCEMETLDDKKNLLMKELSESRNQITGMNTNMILMGQNRDGQVTDIERIQREIQEHRQKKTRLDTEKTELAEAVKKFAAENPMSDTYKTVMASCSQKKLTCEKLGNSLAEIEKETAKTLESIDESNAKLAELKQILAREEAELKRLQELHQAKVTQYQHTKINLQNQKIENSLAKPINGQDSILSQITAKKEDPVSAPKEDPFAAFREVQAEDEKKRQEAEKLKKEQEAKAAAAAPVSAAPASDIFAAFENDPFATSAGSEPPKPADPNDPFSSFGAVSSKPESSEEKKDPFAGFADFGSFEFSSKSSQSKPAAVPAAVTSIEQKPPASSSPSLFASSTTSSTTTAAAPLAPNSTSLFDSSFKTDVSVPETKKDQPQEVKFTANFDAFSAASVEATETAAVTKADVSTSAEPTPSEVIKGSGSSVLAKANMMSLDLTKPLPEHLRAVLSRYKALFDFVGQGDDELSFKKGDIILVGKSQDAEPGWLGGELRGQTGWFPENHVQKLPSEPNSPVTNGPSGGTSWANFKTTEPEKPATEKSSSPFTQVESSTSTPQQKPSCIAEAMSDFEGKEANHLSFKAGDKIAVTEQQDMWWAGELNGKTGWFPRNLVKESGSIDSSATQSAPSETATSTAKQEKVEYEAMYNYTSAEPGDLQFNAGEIITVIRKEGEWWKGRIGDREGDFPSNYVRLKELQPPELPPKSSKKNEIAKVIAPYQATGRGQLSLTVGQLIMIKKKNESGWWEGELQARGKKRQVGWFPANYVTLLTPSKSGTLPKSPQTLSSPVPSDQRLTPGLEVICQVITLYPYTKSKEDEISFQKGMVINVMSKDDGEWWKGELNGAVGYFPSNYVQELKDSGRSVPSDDS